MSNSVFLVNVNTWAASVFMDRQEVSPMSTEFSRLCNYTPAVVAKATAEGDIARRTGDIRGVTLNRPAVNQDVMVGMASAVRESIEQAFGKDVGKREW
jgi:hypothetical protein